MNTDRLKQAWNASISNPPTEATLDSLIMQAKTRARGYRSEVLKRTFFGATVFCLALAMLVMVWLLPGPEIWLGMRVAMLLWGIGLIACVVGLWPLRVSRLNAGDAPLQSYLQACLEHVQREIAYQRSLRWRWWAPFGIGLASAIAQRLSPQPDISWLLGLFALLASGWGFVHAPRSWPERLRAEEAGLRDLLDRTRAVAREGGGP
ncbi:hypothetical protein [Frateuria soli]|uniref:hypothetical protein n=1 Tax=Frateuria soli TaxID=1542730 RepID=UPI001E45541A|nr:hypothetical protein [Frateuria soli]UGB39732.1 hypothetical protein LQ771_07860 [Frateuria soli]